METQVSTEGKRTRRAKGRQDRTGQETVINVDALNEAMPKLVKLRQTLAEAAADYSEAVKLAAEKSGYLAAVIRRLADAKAGDKFDDVKRIVDQMAEAFSLS